MISSCSSKRSMKALSSSMRTDEASCPEVVPQFYWTVHDGAVYQGIKVAADRFQWVKRAVCRCGQCRAQPLGT